jgi:hypothetical protein
LDRFIVDVVQGHAIETEGDDYGEVEVEVSFPYLFACNAMPRSRRVCPTSQRLAPQSGFGN